MHKKNLDRDSLASRNLNLSVIAIVISLIALALHAVNFVANWPKQKYEVHTSQPILEIFRGYDEGNRDIISVINRGGAVENPRGQIYSFMTVVAQTKSKQSNTKYLVPKIFSRLKQVRTPDDEVILQTFSTKSFGEREAEQKLFMEKMATEETPGSYLITPVLQISYDYLGEEHKKYFWVINPGFASFESDTAKEYIDEIFSHDGVPSIYNEDEMESYAKRWIVGEHAQTGDSD